MQLYLYICTILLKMIDSSNYFDCIYTLIHVSLCVLLLQLYTFPDSGRNKGLIYLDRLVMHDIEPHYIDQTDTARY